MMNFELRPFELTDLASLVKHANNYNIAKNLSNKFAFPYTTDHGIAFINLALSAISTEIFAIAINGLAVGSIGVHPKTDVHCKNAELGYWIGEDYWGKGIVSEAVKLMVRYGFKTFDITRIYASTYDINLKSQSVLKKAGFELEATFKETLYKNGTFYDEVIYGYRKPTF